MKKMVNKKAQGQWGIMFGLVLGVIVLVLAGYFIYNFFGAVEQGAETFKPEQIDLKVLSCQGYASPSFKDTFCKFQKIEKFTYLNCDYPEVKERLTQSEVTCDDDTAEKFCVTLKPSDIPKIRVNGVVCPDIDESYAEGLCEVIGETFSYKDGDDWQAHICEAGDGTIPA